MTIALASLLLGLAGAVAGWRAQGARRRALLPAFGAAGAVLVVWSVLGLVDGQDGDVPIVLVGIPIVAFGVVTLARRSSTAASDAWHASEAAVLNGTFGGTPPPAGTCGVVAALGRAESRDLLRSPWFGAGIGFCVLVFLLFGVVFDPSMTEWAAYVYLAHWFAHPLVGMTVVAAHRAVTRSRRDHTDELMTSCPVDRRTRTLGVLAAAPVPVAVLASTFVALGIAVGAHGAHGRLGFDVGAEIAAALALGIGGVALGVALGRWVPFGLAPIIAVVAVAFLTPGINTVGTAWHPVTALSTAPAAESMASMFQDRPEWWHLLWICGLIILVGVLALAKDQRDRTILLTALAAAGLLTASGIGATRPMAPESAERIAGLVAHPEAHQRCRSVAAQVRVCAFDGEDDLLHRVTQRVGPVARALPTDIEPLTVRQRLDGEVAALPPEVRRQLEDEIEAPSDEVSMGFDEVGDDPDGVVRDPGFDVALTSLGIPPEPDGKLLPTVVAGEARGVVAIWVGTRGLDPDERARASTSPAAGASSDPFALGSLEDVDDPCVAPAVVWSAQDLDAARSVLALDESLVAAAVTDGWDRWADPSTSTGEFLAELGLPSAGPYDRIEPRPGNSC